MEMINQTWHWESYLEQQALAHPAMEPQDVYKMLYQAVYGAEHLLQDIEAAWNYFQEEYEGVKPGSQVEPLWEQIGEKVYRVNLRVWKKQQLPPEWLFGMFVGSVEMSEAICKDERQDCGLKIRDVSDDGKPDGGDVNREDKSDSRQAVWVTKQNKERDFFRYIDVAQSLAEKGIFTFSAEEFAQYSLEYQKQAPRAVHHSEKYRLAERPSYRLVNRRFLRLIPLLQQMAKYKNEGSKKVIIAIDGRCASGKSTMAAMLSRVVGASVIHMDDFYLPVTMRTPERLEQPGGNVHRERFMEEVMPGLKAGQEFTYRRFDCSTMELGEERKVAKAWAYVVEGAYSHHPELGDYADIKVFSHVEYEEQLRRIEARDGGKCLPMFQKRWIPFEEKYFAAYSIRENADLRL